MYKNKFVCHKVYYKVLYHITVVKLRILSGHKFKNYGAVYVVVMYSVNKRKLFAQGGSTTMLQYYMHLV